MQWTIDPGRIKASGEVCSKAERLYDARVIVRRSRRGFRTPSWTQDTHGPDRYCQTCHLGGSDTWFHPENWHHQIVVVDPTHDTETLVLKITCDCSWSQAAKPGDDPCHHAFGVALEYQRLEFPDYRIVAKHPKPGPPRKTKRSRLTVIPGGRA